MGFPKRDSQYGVGKRMGKNLYLHRSALDAVSGLRERVRGFVFDVVKINESAGTISLICSSDFDTADEPTVESSIILRADGTHRKISLPRADPWIYHHKWLFVRDEYTGFDVEESKQRSRKWLALDGVDTSRIGKRSFWEATVSRVLADKKCRERGNAATKSYIQKHSAGSGGP